MNIKERILETLKKEFEPLGYRYLKSRSIFKRNVGKDIIVHLYYNASRFHREFTIVNFFLHGDFRDIKEVLHNQNIIDDIEYWLCLQTSMDYTRKVRILIVGFHILRRRYRESC